MMPRKRPYALLALASLTLSLSCAPDNPTAVVTPPAQSLVGDLSTKLTGLLTCTPMPKAKGSATIGPEGGTLTVGAHTLTVPPGALSAQVKIKATAPSDSVNRVEFDPEGLQFARPASLTMSYANCNTLGKLVPKRIAYTTDALVILEYLPSIDDLASQEVTGQLQHFSSYAVAW